MCVCVKKKPNQTCITCQNHLTFSIIMNHHLSIFLFSPPMPAIPNTLQQPAALDINTKSHISLILSDRDVLLTPQKKSFWPSVYPLLLIAAKNTSPIKTPNSLKSFHFQTSIQFPAVSWTQLNEPWSGISTVPVSDHGRQFCPPCDVGGSWRAGCDGIGDRYLCLHQTPDCMLHW